MATVPTPRTGSAATNASTSSLLTFLGAWDQVAAAKQVGRSSAGGHHCFTCMPPAPVTRHTGR